MKKISLSLLIGAFVFSGNTFANEYPLVMTPSHEVVIEGEAIVSDQIKEVYGLTKNYHVTQVALENIEGKIFLKPSKNAVISVVQWDDSYKKVKTFDGKENHKPVKLYDIDKNSGHWAHGYVDQLVEKGIIYGYPNHYFLGDQPITRYEESAMIARVLDSISGANKKINVKTSINYLKPVKEPKAISGVPFQLVPAFNFEEVNQKKGELSFEVLVNQSLYKEDTKITYQIFKADGSALVGSIVSKDGIFQVPFVEKSYYLIYGSAHRPQWNSEYFNYKDDFTTSLTFYIN